ncbi:hypothetical protein F4809DRAFT_639124 [Biscogniauxia mediterranea]|nr:hypothetical protein F4809DRAFT_639124 [Biscogniauxia mediterranea]
MASDRNVLLTGTCTYRCFHKFSWILDHHLPRVGDRSPNTHDCPKCSTNNPTCLVCLEPFDARTSDSCPSCDLFFFEPLLKDRQDRLEALNLDVGNDKASTILRARIQHKKELLRAKHAEKIQA